VPRAIITLVLLLVPFAAARADSRIISSAGGEVGSYLRLFAAVRQSGEGVIIDGPCLSACRLVLSTIPQDRICVTPGPSSASMLRAGSSAGPAICGARRDAPRHRDLSGRSARLDQAQRRSDAKTDLPARTPACGALSELPAAPFRLQSSLNPPNKSGSEANGGQIAARHISAVLEGLLARVRLIYLGTRHLAHGDHVSRARRFGD
jgi:hypothetical protein